MKPHSCIRLLIAISIAVIGSRSALATQADETTIAIIAEVDGPTPFISQLSLIASETDVLKSIQFAITPKTGSVTRALSGTYSSEYLEERGYLNAETGEIFLPVYGLYADFSNTVTLTYRFLDGSSKQDTTMITTPAFDDPCGYDNGTPLQARSDSTALSYDYIMVMDACGSFSPAVLDTDGALRWVGTAGASSSTARFFDNAVYQSQGTVLYRVELDGTVTTVHDYNDTVLGAAGAVTLLHHNIDLGKTGLILEADTENQVESTLFEIDSAGNVLKSWVMADIISAAMVAGGDDPSQFVYDAPNDWFHNNSATYNRADDSLLVSSRENFVISLDYESATIKWILGDPTKHWYEFPSLQQYALALASGSLPPIGQHGLSISYDQQLLLFDNGFQSSFQMPPGDGRGYASPRKYALDLAAKTATETWNYEMDQSVYSPICGSIYEDAPLNYLVNYADVGGPGAPTQFAQLLGLTAADTKVFYYQYDTFHCETAYRSIPLHLERTAFPVVGPQSLNIATRGMISTGENVLIAGFIVTGTVDKEVVLRALGPSLTAQGIQNAVGDPLLMLFDSSGTLVATNDDWQDDPRMAEIIADGLAPGNDTEAATVQALAPGQYTVIASGKGDVSGIGLVETYDLSPQKNSRLANISARGSVGIGENVLISGFIVGEVDSSTVVLRALGPSLESAGVQDALADPLLTVFDANGSVLATNDNWQDDSNSLALEQNSLAPAEDSEAATILHLPTGAYTAIVSGVGSTGVALVEIYNLE